MKCIAVPSLMFIELSQQQRYRCRSLHFLRVATLSASSASSSSAALGSLISLGDGQRCVERPQRGVEVELPRL